MVRVGEGETVIDVKPVDRSLTFSLVLSSPLHVDERVDQLALWRKMGLR